MPSGHVFGHIRLSNHLTVAFVGCIPPVADQEGGGLLRGVAVVTLDHVGVGLEEEPNVRVADPLADHLRADAGFERAGRVGMPQIVGAP